MLQPHLDFANGYCDVNCHRCADVCPTGALLSYPPEQKLRLTIGVAIFHEDRCLRATEGVTCDNCVRHCPLKIITLRGEPGRELPTVEKDACIGCGSCEYHCPASPKALVVHGRMKQHLIGDGTSNPMRRS